MSAEPRETFRLVLTRIVGTEPIEVAFFLRDRDDNLLHSGSMLFSEIRTRFKAAFNTSDQSLATLESNVRNRREIDQPLRDETYGSLRVAGLLPPLQVAPKVDIEIHVDAKRR
jgi:hypothetical protein